MEVILEPLWRPFALHVFMFFSQMAPNIVPSSTPANEDVRKFQEMKEKLHKAADKKGIKLNKFHLRKGNILQKIKNFN